LRLARPLADEFRRSVPVILERIGFASGEVTITSLPEVSFPLEAEGKVWTATYNPLTGSLQGTLPEQQEPRDLSTRQLLLSLHVAHGYPHEANARWYWAVIVDAMAAIMCFWALTGLLMWWQIKATRRLGTVVLVLSGAVAFALGYGMLDALSH
jgi:hypothetical protein